MSWRRGRGRERSVLELKTVRILILKNLEKAVTHMHYSLSILFSISKLNFCLCNIQVT